MRRPATLVLAAAVLSIGAIGSASGADLRPAPPPYKAPPAPLPPPVFNWTGFYVGVNLGGSWANQDVSFVDHATGAVLTESFDLHGVIGGAQIGYNWQSYGPWVFGLEADIQGSHQREHASLFVPGVGTGTFEDTLDWFGTVRGRVGYAMGYGGRWMPYITGGLAYGDNNISFPGVGETKTQVGWTVGAGLEWAFWDRWSAKLEYLYMDLGEGPTVAVTPAFTITTDHLTDNIARVGVNYRF